MSGPTYVDPPFGWLYGFPKLWDGEGDMTEWLRKEGYPNPEDAAYVRCWYPSDDDVCAVQQKLSSP